MAETLLSIQEAAAATGKSIQTIRRAIKSRKVIAKRRKTPQGFNYMVTQESVVSFYKLNKDFFRDREKGSLDTKGKASAGGSSSDFATLQDLQGLQHEMEELLGEYKKEKESFMRFRKAFQDRFVVLENQLKLLEEPKKKRWFQFWQ